MKLVIALLAAVACDSFTHQSVALKSNLVSAATTANVEFTISKTMPKDGIIKITTPSSMRVSSSSMTAPKGGDSGGIGGTTNLKVDGNVITIKRGGDGSAAASGSILSFAIGGLINPAKSGDTGNFAIQTHDADGNIIESDEAVAGTLIDYSSQECEVEIGPGVSCESGRVIAAFAAMAIVAAIIALFQLFVEVEDVEVESDSEDGITLYWEIRGHTNICTDDIRPMARELSMRRAKAVITETMALESKETIGGKPTVHRALKNTMLTPVGCADDFPEVHNISHPNAGSNLRVEVFIANPEDYHMVLSHIVKQNPGWSPREGFAHIGAPDIRLHGEELEHPKINFDTHEATLVDKKVTTQIAKVIRYLDNEAALVGRYGQANKI